MADNLNEPTVRDVYNTFSTRQRSVLSMVVGLLPSMSDDQLRVAAFLFNAAVEDQVLKRERDTS